MAIKDTFNWLIASGNISKLSFVLLLGAVQRCFAAFYKRIISLFRVKSIVVISTCNEVSVYEPIRRTCIDKFAVLCWHTRRLCVVISPECCCNWNVVLAGYALQRMFLFMLLFNNQAFNFKTKITLYSSIMIAKC